MKHAIREQEFRVIIRKEGETRGRAYIKHDLRKVNETTASIEIIRQRPGLGVAPTWNKADAEHIRDYVLRMFPTAMVTIKAVRAVK